MKEKKVIILTAILNVIVASIKLVLGIIFSFSTLIFDSIQSFVDFFTDLISLITNKIGKRRANRIYPFGYGQVYYLSNLLTGLLLFLISLFLVYQFFAFNNEFKSNIVILIVLTVVLVLKLVVITLLKQNAKITKNELLIESYKESKADLLSTCVVIIVLLISLLEKYIPLGINFDKIGSACMAIYVFYTSIKMIISNIKGILINDEHNEELKEEIIEELEKIKNLHIINLKVIKMSNYYSVFLQIDIDDNLKIKDFIKLEQKIKKRIKDTNKLIKYIDIEPQ